MAEFKANDRYSETVLLVDDEPFAIEVFGEFLKQYYRVRAANSGREALAQVKAKPKPDLILLDVMMPEMDGYQVLTVLKADPETKDIPVIFLTALSDHADEERGLQLGAADYISKPCTLSILLARVRTQIELQKNRAWLQDQNAFLETELKRRIQENQKVQLQLLQSDKLAAIGQLSAGIAHEINNPVGFVNSNLECLQEDVLNLWAMLDASEALIPAEAQHEITAIKQQYDIEFLRQDIPKLIEESLDGLSQVNNVIRSLKDFSHIGTDDWRMADIHQGLESTLNIVWNALKHHCAIHKDYGDLPKVYCQPFLLNQVFMNLLLNAAQAIEGKGDISICTKRLGSQVSVAISDTGHGIKPEHLNSLFEPFFTTKEVGKGTGLGLSISQNIIETHRGKIEVTSKPGQGATFRVILPIQPPEHGA